MTTNNSQEAQQQTYPAPPSKEAGTTGEWIAFAGELVTDAARRISSPPDTITAVVDSWIERYGVSTVATAFQALTPDVLEELAVIVAKRGVASLGGRVGIAEDLLASIEG